MGKQSRDKKLNTRSLVHNKLLYYLYFLKEFTKVKDLNKNLVKLFPSQSIDI